jgi:signal transduction histidine kinase
MSTLRTLLVEDSENDAELILLALVEAGLSVDLQRVETAEEFRAALTQGSWDLVISDLNLPRFSASAALAMLYQFDCDIPFIVVSGFIGEEAAVAILKAGAHDFVTKDNLSRLAPAIRRELREAENRRAHFQTTIDLIESRRQLRALTGHLQNVREEERAHIARELHDELGQMLTALKMDVAWLNSRCQSCKASGIGSKLAEMGQLIDSTIAAARRISAALRPTMLDDLGLKAAVEWLIEDFAKHNEGINCALRFELGEQDVGDQLATAAFRIVQECLTNISRHAAASTLEVRIGLHEQQLIIHVSDNGRGLPAQATRQGSYGLIGMRERAEALGGTLVLSNQPTGGLSVEANLPLTSTGEQP